MKETRQISAHIKEKSAVQIEKLAEQDDRSFSSMVDVLLKEALSYRQKSKEGEVK